MDRRTFSRLVAGATAALSIEDTTAGQQPGSPSLLPDLTMWYRQPAAEWAQAVKVGNGRLGGTVSGIPGEERIGLNHTWLWRKQKLGGLKNPVVSQNLPEVRKLFFEGKLGEANQASNRLLGSQGICKPDDDRYRDFGPDPFQPAGDLDIALAGHANVTNYRRSLDLATNIARVAYECRGVRYTREVFVSFVDDVILIRLDASKPGALSGIVDLFRIPDKDCTLLPWAEGNRVGFVGAFLEKVSFAVSAQVFVQGGKGQARVNPSKAVALWSEETNGRGGGHSMRRVGRPEFSIDGASQVIIAVALATDRESPDPRKLTESQLDKVRGVDYSALAERHRTGYGRLFHRMSVALEGPDRSGTPTDERLAAHLKGAEDPQLVAMLFQYARNELIGSSRSGGAPANLTGI
jgi:alpha-L-fucosidase 2